MSGKKTNKEGFISTGLFAEIQRVTQIYILAQYALRIILTKTTARGNSGYLVVSTGDSHSQ